MNLKYYIGGIVTVNTEVGKTIQKEKTGGVSWLHEMDDLIGKTGIIREFNGSRKIIRVLFTEGCHYWFNEEQLIFTEPPVNTTDIGEI